MDGNRRGFLKAAGFTVLAVGTGTVSVLRSARARPDAPTPSSQPAGANALVGKRWGLLVDTTRCKAREGCQDCRRACHRAHNVPDLPEPRHEIKWIWTERFRNTFPDAEHEFMAPAILDRPVAVLCNHCENPPCVRVCPTKATWKRPDGIVMMDWHRCIGCRFCAVGCPYGARSFNWRDPRPFLKEQNPDFPTRYRGVVEKCTFCDERLARGLLPACVVSCKQKALTFGDLADDRSEIRRLLASVRALRRKPALGTMPKVFYVV
ncbi:MAG: 4Fe-4S dicluster domain-containing protein [Deltaproteobacteria bacterium]|nr:4Fe-4S dicluster domain-containing protein [Deltaproteobacteria bacterium]